MTASTATKATVSVTGTRTNTSPLVFRLQSEINAQLLTAPPTVFSPFHAIFMLPGLSSIHASPTYQVDSMTSDTLAMVSHDLRSTLNALGVTMDLLSEGHLGALNEKGQRLVS